MASSAWSFLDLRFHTRECISRFRVTWVCLNRSSKREIAAIRPGLLNHLSGGREALGQAVLVILSLTCLTYCVCRPHLQQKTPPVGVGRKTCPRFSTGTSALAVDWEVGGTTTVASGSAECHSLMCCCQMLTNAVWIM